MSASTHTSYEHLIDDWKLVERAKWGNTSTACSKELGTISYQILCDLSIIGEWLFIRIQILEVGNVISLKLETLSTYLIRNQRIMNLIKNLFKRIFNFKVKLFIFFFFYNISMIYICVRLKKKEKWQRKYCVIFQRKLKLNIEI